MQLDIYSLLGTTNAPKETVVLILATLVIVVIVRVAWILLLSTSPFVAIAIEIVFGIAATLD